MLELHMEKYVRSFIHSFIKTAHINIFHLNVQVALSIMTYCVEKNCTRFRSMDPIMFHTRTHTCGQCWV